MTIISSPSPAQAPNCLKCSKCDVEIDAGCDCGVDYVPAGQRVAEYDKANPGRSTRVAAADLNLDNATVHRARKSGVAHATPATVTGRDGKRYSARRPRVVQQVEKPTGIDDDPVPVVNPLIAGWEVATQEQRAEFEKYIAGLKKKQQLAKLLARTITDPARNLNSAQLGEYLNLQHPKFVAEAVVDHAPKLWAMLGQLAAEKKLKTTEFSQVTLLKANSTAGSAVH